MLTRRQRWIRRLLLVPGLLLAVIAALPWLVSVESFRPEIELQLSQAIDHEVRIKALSLQTLPRLQLVADDITIASAHSASRVQVSRLNVVPDTAALLAGRIEIHQLRLRDAQVNREFVEAMLALGRQPHDATGTTTRGEDVAINEVVIERLRFVLDPARELGPYDVNLRLGAQRQPLLVSLRRSDGHARLDLVAVEQGFNVALHGQDWQPPLGPPLVFKRIDAEGLLDDEQLQIGALNATAYSGTLQGKGRIAWHKGWSIIGHLDGNRLDSEPLLAVFLAQPVIAGRFDGGFDFTLRAAQPAQLGAQPQVSGTFAFRDGVIYNADLEKATNLLNSGPTQGGRTPFSELSGQMLMQRGAIRLDQLKLRSDALEASGKLRISAQQQLAGEVEVGVTRTGSLVSVPLKVAGSIEQPSLRPTDAAMAGGAVGTGLLGPGVGTAVGVKVGNFFSNLFGSDDEDAEAKPADKALPQADE